jgi:predicted permease
MDNIAVKTTIPIFFLMGAGLLSRRTGILKSGDERVLSAYVYYFAMPALSLLNLAETEERSVIFRKGNGAEYGMVFTGGLSIITGIS